VSGGPSCIKERIENPQGETLQPFSSECEKANLPFTLSDYLELVKWAGREIKRGKKGYIPSSQPPILQRLNMHSSPVLGFLNHNEKCAPVALGPISQLRNFAQSVGRHFIKGHFMGKRLFPEPG